MQREASEARQATDLPRSVAFDNGRVTSRPVSYGMLNTFCCVKLRCVTIFDGVHPVLLRMSRSEEELQSRTFLIHSAVGC